MKPKFQTLPAAGLPILLLVLSSASLHAQSTWSGNVSGNWGDTARWTGGVPNGAGAVANVTFDISAARTVTLNGTSGTNRTVGTLTIGDTTGRNAGFTIAAATGNSLIFDSGSASAATLTTTAGGSSDTISAPIILKSNLDINNVNSDASNTRTLRLSGDITTDVSGTRLISVTGVSATANVRLSGAMTDGAGSLSISKVGANILTIDGASNTYSGGVTLSAGTLYLNSESALGNGALTISGAGTLGSTVATTLSAVNAQQWNSDFTFGGSANLNMGLGGVALSGNRIVTLAGTLTAGVGPVITIGGAVTGSASLTTVNSGTTPTTAAGVTTVLNLAGTNTYNGGTNVNGGVVRFDTAAAIPTTGMITVGSFGALSVSGAHETLASWLGESRLDIASSGALALVADSSENFVPGAFTNLSLGSQVGSTVVYTGTITPSAAGYLIGGGGGSIEFSNTNAFTGAGGVTVGNGGSGTVIISNSNNYGGTTTVKRGALLSVTHAGALGTTIGSTVVESGGGVRLNGGVTVTGEALTIHGTTSATGANNVLEGLSSGSGNNTWTGNISAVTSSGNNVRFGAIGGDLQITGNVALSGHSGASLVLTGASGTGTISGTISGTALNTPIIKNGDSTWTLTGANTFTGIVRMDDGVLSVATIGSTAVAGNLGKSNSTLGFGESSNTGTLRYTGTGEVSTRPISFRSASGSGGGVIEQTGSGELEFSGVVGNTISTMRTLTLSGSSTGAGKLSGVISGAINIGKTGTGTWTLSGVNTYTGATTVSGGTLIASGKLNSTTGVTVNGGTFALGASTVVNDAATVTLGGTNGGGTLRMAGFSDSFGALTLAAGASVLDLSGGDSVTTFTLTSATAWTGSLSILGWASASGAERVEFTLGLTTDRLAAITFDNPVGFEPGIYTSKLVGIEVMPDVLIPEPSSVLLLAAGAVTAGFRRRRN